MVRIERHLPCNSPAACRTLVETVFKMLDNILAQPEEVKFRDLRASNKLLVTKVLSAQGGTELMHLLGFQKVSKQS